MIFKEGTPGWLDANKGNYTKTCRGLLRWNSFILESGISDNQN